MQNILYFGCRKNNKYGKFWEYGDQFKNCTSHPDLEFSLFCGGYNTWFFHMKACEYYKLLSTSQYFFLIF
jgi:hypothetical protein